MAGSSSMDLLLDFALAPALWLGLVLALSFSVFFYSWRGGGMRQLGRDLLAGVGGFAAGQIFGMLFRVDWLQMGALQLFAGSAGAIIALWSRRLLLRRAGKKR